MSQKREPDYPRLVKGRRWLERGMIWLGLGLALLMLALGIVGAFGASEIVGRASVVDGDTIEIQGERIRLHAIDAPESAQRCRDGSGREYRCGKVAAEALDTLFAMSRPTRCEPVERDRYGRIVARCFAGQVDINGRMVRDGHALAYRQYGLDYVQEEDVARSARRGLWQGEFVPPWEWRRGERIDAQPASARPHGCMIKGNISSNGRIFHVPGQEHYERTRIDEGKGERWFCSQDAARAAGWRPARR